VIFLPLPARITGNIGSTLRAITTLLRARVAADGDYSDILSYYSARGPISWPYCDCDSATQCYIFKSTRIESPSPSQSQSRFLGLLQKALRISAPGTVGRRRMVGMAELMADG